MQKHTTEYDRYMRSDEWSKKRAERLELDNNHCVMCGRMDCRKTARHLFCKCITFTILI